MGQVNNRTGRNGMEEQWDRGAKGQENNRTGLHGIRGQWDRGAIGQENNRTGDNGMGGQWDRKKGQGAMGWGDNGTGMQ